MSHLFPFGETIPSFLLLKLLVPQLLPLTEPPMALENVKLGLALVLVTMICDKVTAQSGCTSVLLGLAPCLNYITGNLKTPTSSCCSQLSSVVQSQPQCLCSALNGGGSSLGITINQTRALSLPGACNVQTPPISRCNAANAPAVPPVSSAASPQADSPDETPDTPATSSMPSIPSVSPQADSSDETPDTPATSSMPSIPSGTGSKTIPRTEGSTSNASIMKMPLTLTLFTMFIAAFISLITFG